MVYLHMVGPLEGPCPWSCCLLLVLAELLLLQPPDSCASQSRLPVEKVTHSWHFGWRGAVQPGTACHAHSRSSRAISVYEGDKFAKMEGSHQNKSLSLSHES